MAPDNYLNIKKLAGILFSLLILISCGKNENDPAPVPLMELETVAPGDQCESGGIEVFTGLDADHDGLLGSSEIQNSAIICNGVDGNDGETGDEGSDGINTLIETDLIPPGEICPAGGLKISTGMDINRNNLLDESEITAVSHICNGVTDVPRVRIFDFGFTHATFNPLPYIQDWEQFDGALIQFFNILHYPEVDSVAFLAHLNADKYADICYIQLYDYTNGVEIEESTLSIVETDQSMQDPTFEIVSTTENLLQYLPEEEITLGIRLKTESGERGQMKLPTLILYSFPEE